MVSLQHNGQRMLFFKMAAVHEAQAQEGTCQLMCPVDERLARERQQRLHAFEILKGTERERKPKADPKAAVKEYSRCAAGKEIRAQELRPANVLLTTMDYLIDYIADRDDQPWHVVYLFMSDRIRAIRQDMVVQQISGEAAIILLEKASRFYILAGYKLCENSVEVFSPELNNNHIQECLKRLLAHYENEDASSCPNRAEFESYYLLFNLRSNGAHQRFMTLPRCVFYNSLLQLAHEINKSAMQGNFVRFFRQVRRLPFLASCAVHKWFRKVQVDALEVMNTAFSSRVLKFPMTSFAESLEFSSLQEAKDFCTYYGVQADSETISFLKGSFQEKDHLFSTKKSCNIDKKCSESVRDLLRGMGPQRAKTCEGLEFDPSDATSDKSVGKKKGIGRGWIGKNKRLP